MGRYYLKMTKKEFFDELLSLVTMKSAHFSVHSFDLRPGNDLHDKLGCRYDSKKNAVVVPVGNIDGFVKEVTRLWRDSWVVPKVEFLRDKMVGKQSS